MIQKVLYLLNCEYNFLFEILFVIGYFMQLIIENLVKVLFLKSFYKHLGGVCSQILANLNQDNVDQNQDDADAQEAQKDPLAPELLEVA